MKKNELMFLIKGNVTKPSGSFKVIHEYIKELSHEGVSIIVADLERDNFINLSVNFIKNIAKKIFKVDNWYKVEGLCLHVKVKLSKILYEDNVIVLNSWQMAEEVMKYNNIKAKILYIVHHDESIQGKYSKERVEATIKSSFYKLAVSINTYNYVRGVTSNNVFYVQNGLDHKTYYLKNTIKNRKIDVCMAYSSKKIKDCDTAIRALNVVRNMCSDVRVVFYGFEDGRAIVPEWIEYYVTPKECFLVDEIYNKSKIYLCTSVLEGFGFPVAEAMACGCAAITTDCGGVLDFSIDEKTALVSKVGDFEKLANDIIFLLNNEECRLNLIENGLKEVGKLSWNAGAKKIVNIVEND